VATARLEYLKEGIQECEARVFLEGILLDEEKRVLLGEDLARRCQQALDEHHRAMWKTVWSNDDDLALLGKVTARNPVEALWDGLVKQGKQLPGFWDASARTMRAEEAKKGIDWFVSGWQDREKKLFALAGEAAGKLGAQ